MTALFLPVPPIIPFILFSCLTTLADTSSTMLKREQQRSYLVSDLKGNVSVLTSEHDAGRGLCTHPATSAPQVVTRRVRWAIMCKQFKSVPSTSRYLLVCGPLKWLTNPQISFAPLGDIKKVVIGGVS